MFHLDDEKIEIALGNKALVFWQGKKAENVLFYISDVEIRGIYLSLVYLSWLLVYCQIQSTRLIMLFTFNFLGMTTIENEKRNMNGRYVNCLSSLSIAINLAI